MDQNRRGRPALPDAEKRQQIGVRTSPVLKASLERSAAENGRSVAQEAELRLIRSFEQEVHAGDAPTARLLSMIADEIAVIQNITGKRWHKDLTTWAATAEALSQGPIKALRPDSLEDDEVVREAWDSYWAISEAKTALLEELRAHGLNVPDQPQRRLGMFANGAIDSERKRTSAEIDALGLGPSEDEALRDLLNSLVAMDETQSKRKASLDVAMRPFTEAEVKGRILYKQKERERTAKMAMLSSAVERAG